MVLRVFFPPLARREKPTTMRHWAFPRTSHPCAQGKPLFSETWDIVIFFSPLHAGEYLTSSEFKRSCTILTPARMENPLAIRPVDVSFASHPCTQGKSALVGHDDRQRSFSPLRAGKIPMVSKFDTGYSVLTPARRGKTKLHDDHLLFAQFSPLLAGKTLTMWPTKCAGRLLTPARSGNLG